MSVFGGAGRAGSVRAALIGLAGLLLVVVLVFNVNNLPLVGAGPTYRAAFTDAAGLQVGEEVRVAGLKSGDVTDIEVHGAQVVVSFRVKGQRLGRDTRASIEIKTLLGQHFLGVDPRGPGALAAGTEIPLTRTSTPVEIVPTLQRATTIVTQIDTKRLDAAFDTLSSALRGTAPEVRRTLDGLTSLSRTVASRDEQIQRLFAQARSVTGVVAGRNAQISQLIEASNQVLGLLDARRTDIERLLVGVRELSTQVSGLVKDNRDQLRPALQRLGQVTEVLQRNDGNVRKLLTQLPVYVRLLTNVVGSGPWFDANVALPRTFALCDSGSTPRLASVFNPILSQLNQAVNKSSAPCLPAGPAATGGGR